MDKQAWFGILVGALGLGLGAAVGTMHMIIPEADSLKFTPASVGTVALLMLGLAIIAWPRKRSDEIE